jgi:tetratricopeptide (TPR) repeat protein
VAHDANGQPGNSSAPPAREESPELHFRRLVEQNPDRIDAWRQLALIALRQGRHESAVESRTRAALAPKQPLVHHHLATCCQALGQFEPVVHHFRQAGRLCYGLLVLLSRGILPNTTITAATPSSNLSDHTGFWGAAIRRR